MTDKERLESTRRLLTDALREKGELHMAIVRGGFDLSPCKICGETVVCLPEGFAYCQDCVAKQGDF